MPVLVELLKDPDSDVRSRAASLLGGWGKAEDVVRAMLPKLIRKDAGVVGDFFVKVARGGPRKRSDKVNELLAKALKPNSRDSAERRALRQIVFQWTWDATATTA